MFEKIGRLAEAAATNVSVSRRGFFGRLGQRALAVAGVLGGALAFPRDALAAGSYVCCEWKCYVWRYKRGNSGSRMKVCYPPGTSCLLHAPCVYPVFIGQTAVNSCTSCK
jgi:hypothetical protein